MNREESQKSSNANAWITGMVVAVVLYILSPGPLVLVLEKSKSPPPSLVDDAIGFIYAPLGWGMDHVPAVKAFYVAYLKLFGVHIA